MPSIDLLPVLLCIFIGAALYTSVGHGGATVYTAILTLFSFAIAPLVTLVLVMNIAAAAIAWVMYQQAGFLRPRLLLPFVVTSVPSAYLGGLLPITGRTQALLLGLALLAAAIRLLFFAKPPSLDLRIRGIAYYAIAAAMGALLGFLAGATGIGGGIFLSPILIALGWANVKEAASVASAFIVLNSIAGLIARLPRTPIEPHYVAPFVAIVIIGALLGSFMGARRLPFRAVQVSLGFVLLIAAGRNLLG
ncbi:MAG: sulfite exporter TauE/SafE family protein [Chloroflexi bacterium]|nr:MAG: sulfite exporter TauE/SafE family protein [Chloroflexota bacterium]TMC57778.1 MAG: sulfite exporter TauE/SafE family protein [Chloroflexota bacterium]